MARFGLKVRLTADVAAGQRILAKAGGAEGKIDLLSPSSYKSVP
jgi:hypothetical protein